MEITKGDTFGVRCPICNSWHEFMVDVVDDKVVVSVVFFKENVSTDEI